MLGGCGDNHTILTQLSIYCQLVKQDDNWQVSAGVSVQVQEMSLSVSVHWAMGIRPCHKRQKIDRSLLSLYKKLAKLPEKLLAW